ncbi:MAG: DNA translocase FtsK [Anaerolineae bacterium]
MSRKRPSRKRSRTSGWGERLARWPWEPVGLAVAALGVLSLLGLLSVTRGVLIDQWGAVLRQLLGRGAYIFALGLVVGGVALIPQRGRWWEEHQRRLVGAGVLWLGVTGFLELLAGGPAGTGGGYLGVLVSALLIEALGPAGAGVVLGVATVAGAILLAGIRAERMRGLPDRLRGFWRMPRREPTVPSPGGNLEPRLPPAERSAEISLRLRPAAQDGGHAAVPSEPLYWEGEMPPLDLLGESPYPAAEEADAEHRGRVIEETLASFGVPAQVVSIRPGPTVTQFGVEPGFIKAAGGSRRRVRVSKITALSKDLSLALSAAPIRIEAPVPGRPVVGIEVPNPELTVVSLRGVMDSEEFLALEAPLKLALGRDVSGSVVLADLASMPHLLIAGATGSGKSVCLASLLTCLVFQHPPNRLRLTLIDPKRVELSQFAGLRHLERTVAHTVDEALGVLNWAMAEMDERYRRFASAGARSIDHHNQLAAERGEEPLPYIVLVIDELADLMMLAPDEIERRITRLAQLSRATGIHLLIATQRPSVDVITGLIKANFPARISFAVTSQTDSRVVLDTSGADALLGRGDMLYLAPDASAPVRLQGCFVSDAEIAAVTGFWQKEVGVRSPIEARQAEPWSDVPDEEERDELLDEAIALLRAHQHASTSFLQRRLRIGYPRAARLMDHLEEEGVVGPPEGGGRSRRVLLGEPDQVESAGPAG